MLKITRFVLILALLIGGGSARAAGYFVTITPTISTSEEFTDNANQDRTNRESDWRTRVTPGISINAEGKLRGFGLAYAPIFTYSANGTSDSEVNQYLNASYWEDFSKHLHFNFSNVFSRREQAWYANQPTFTPGGVAPPPEPPSVPLEPPAQEDTTRRGTAPYNQNDTRADLTYQFGPSDSLGFSYLFSYLDNTDPGSEDSYRHRPNLNLQYWFTTHLGTEVELNYEHGDFTGDTPSFDQYGGNFRLIHNFTKHLNGFIGYRQDLYDGESREDDYTVYQPYLGFDYQLSETGYINLAVGYFFRDKREGDDDGNVTVDLDLGTSWNFKRGSIRLNASSGYDQGFYTAQNLGFNYNYGAGISGTYELTKRITSTASLNVIRNEYLDQDPVQKDTTATAMLSLGYEVRKWLFTSLRYSYRIGDSNLPDNDYDENRVMLQITVRPDPLRLR